LLGTKIPKHNVGDRFFADARVDGLVMVSPSTVMLNDVVV
jgi:hypothetical protein